MGQNSAAKTRKSSPSATGIKLTKEQERIRNELNTQGWSLVDTSRFNLNFTISKKQATNTQLHEPNVATAFWFVQNEHRRRWKTPDQLVPLRRFLVRTISNCLPEENLGVFKFQLRHHDGIAATEPGTWHCDGGSIRAITCVQGSTTEFLPHPRSKKIMSIPKGWTLLFTGMQRIFNGNPPKTDFLGNVIKSRKCVTRHRMPIHNGKRKLIVTTFIAKSSLLFPRRKNANTSR